MDVSLSATGVALSRTYYDPNLGVRAGKPGYLENGEFQIYDNWPGLGFDLIASWYKLLGNDSIDNARLLANLLYALTCVLFFFFLLRCHFDLNVAVLSTLLFAVLPQHLQHGAIIYADMWLLPFWLMCFLLFTLQPKYHFLIIFLGIFATLNFMWFVFFVIPALFVMFLHQRYALSIKQMSALLLLCTVCIWLFQKILIFIFSDEPLLWELRQWSVFPIFDNVQHSAKFTLKSSFRLVYEFIPVLILLSCVIYLNKAIIWKNLSVNKSYVERLLFICLTLFFAVVSLPTWFITHSTSVGFFSILIAMVGAITLQKNNQLQPEKTAPLGIAAIIVSVALFNAYPHLANNASETTDQFNKITNKIEQLNQNLTKKPNIILSLRRDRGWLNHGLKMAMKEELRANVFSNRRNKTPSSLVDHFFERTKKLQKYDSENFNPSTFYYVTDFHYSSDTLSSSDVQVRKHTILNGLALYEFNL